MATIMDLTQTAIDKRDEAWEAQFLKLFAQTRVSILEESAKVGPDGWPYLFVEISDSADEPVPRVIEWLSSRGIGLAVNAQKGTPDYVFTYGMIWNFRERGAFLMPAEAREGGVFQLKPGSQVLVAQPSESYLPAYARAVLKQFLADQGLFSARIAMLSVDQKNYDLCFSLESLGEPPQQEHKGIAEALSWFLPAHYSVALISEKAVSGFSPL